jgi:hypothetical protein
MTVSEIRTAQQNGLILAFLSEAEKAELSARALSRGKPNKNRRKAVFYCPTTLPGLDHPENCCWRALLRR